MTDTTVRNEIAIYFRKLAEEAKYWHITTDTDLANAAQEALENLALYEEGHFCVDCKTTDEELYANGRCEQCAYEYAQSRAEESRDD